MQPKGAMKTVNELISALNPGLFELEDIPLEGYHHGGLFHSESCRMIPASAFANASQSHWGSELDKLCQYCWMDLWVREGVGSGALTISAVFEALAGLSKDLEEILEITTSTKDDCESVLYLTWKSLNQSLLNEQAARRGTPVRKWRAAFSKALRFKTQQAREVLLNSFWPEFIEMHLKEELLPKSAETLIEVRGQTLQKRNASEPGDLLDTKLTHLVSMSKAFSVDPSLALLLMAFTESVRKPFLVTEGAAVRLKKVSSAAEIVRLPEDLDSETLAQAMETVEVIYEPRGSAISPYYNLKKAFEAALSL